MLRFRHACGCRVPSMFLFSFLHSVAAVRPSELILLFPFTFSYTHGHYAIIGRFPYRATGGPRVT